LMTHNLKIWTDLFQYTINQSIKTGKNVAT
jgi:hypothetical protein